MVPHYGGFGEKVHLNVLTLNTGFLMGREDYSGSVEDGKGKNLSNNKRPRVL